MLNSFIHEYGTSIVGGFGFTKNSTFSLVPCRLHVLVEEDKKECFLEDNNASSLKVTSLIIINFYDFESEHHKRYPFDLYA